MGGSCRNEKNRDVFYVGGWCPNKCFKLHGGCAASQDGELLKTVDTCELKPESPDRIIDDAIEKACHAIDESIRNKHSLFLYTPDMANEFYWNEFFMKLPVRDPNDGARLAINCCVRTFVDNVGCTGWQKLVERGVTELWLGVESANQHLRNRYNKTPFSNEEVIKITHAGEENGINVCWFLVDGDEDTIETREQTYLLVKEGSPYRIHVGELAMSAI